VWENSIRAKLTEHKDWKAYLVIVNFYPEISPEYCIGGDFRPNSGTYTVYYIRPGVPGRMYGGMLYWRNK